MHSKLFIVFALFAIASGDFVFDNLKNNRHDFYHPCDYLIIGSGGGSGVAAGMLAEGMPNRRICIVERGPDYLATPNASLAIEVNGLVTLSRSRIFSSRILSPPQPTLIDPNTFGPRVLEDWVGNVTGGGGTVNSMGYRRPQKDVFDKLNQTGWTYPEVLDAFASIEDRVGISTSSPTFGPIQSLMSAAFSKSGYSLRSDPLANMYGHWQSYWTSLDDRRTSSYLNYTLPNLGSRVRIFPDIRIDYLIKIPTLKGERYLGAIGEDSQGRIVIFGAQRRVLLGAGVEGTARILLLSGLGNRLPVGQNFWSHTNLQTIHLPNSTYITGFDQVTNRKNNMFGATPEHIIGLSTIYIEEYSPLLPIGFSEIITTNVSSRGVITLNGTNPEVRPIVDHRILTHPADIEAVKRSFAAFREVMAQPEAQNAYVREISPGAAVPTEFSEGYIRSAAGIAHIGGGCHIGSVVDNSLRVYGTRNLHICDMSIYPSPVGVNTYSTAMLAGYQCARFVLEEDA
ncbi:Oxidoreductase, GMC family [Kaumoebavirus]|uniref:Oxidoreductase, GMC family n=1 Tax=Kaumoebavirus TaxID=1859492 RepID=UPI0009C1C618|nr:Oxidoreductase, GMC family [Kaumoebavirus]ARA72085.1 Oxidoreductase, GMC family [Kaumoebavirus]